MYGERYSCGSPDYKKLWENFEKLCRRYKVIWRMKDIIKEYQTGCYNEQISFFD
jgi:predicted metal-binding protein